MTDTKYSPAPTSPPSPPPSYSTAATPPSQPPQTSKPTPTRAPLPLDLPILTHLRSKRLILASASPRRSQLLSLLGLSPTILPCPLPESQDKTLSPFEYVLRTATAKCMHVYAQEISKPGLEPALVLAADTIVVAPSGQILEKPRSEADHIRMLRLLKEARSHKVYTAVVAMAPLRSARDPGYALESCVEETTVFFAQGGDEEVLLGYVRTREGADKAGGYAVQGVGALLVERIEGAWDNVVGLPLRGTLGVMEKVVEKGEEEEIEDEYGDGEH